MSSSSDHPRPPLLRLLRYARGHRARVLWASLWSVLNKLFDLAPPLLIGLAIHVVVEQEDSWLAARGLVDPWHQLLAVGGLTIVIWVLESAFEYAHKVVWRNLAQTLQHELRVDVYAHVQGLELAFFEDRSTGGLLSVLNDDVNQLERFLDGGANDVLQVGTTVLAIGAYYFWLEPSVAWIAMLPMPFVLWGSLAYQRRLEPRYARVREAVGDLNADLAGNLSGVTTIASFTAEEREVERIRARSDAYRLVNRDAIRLSSAFSPLIRMVILVGFAATLLAGGRLAIDGRLDAGAYASMVFMTQRLLWPLTALGATFDLYQRAMASTRRLLDLLDLAPRILDGPRRVRPTDVEGQLELREVSFAYDDREPVFDRLSLALPAGRTTAIVGATGAGKTTLVKLLLRFYDPDSGAVLLDGVDLREYALRSLRGAIGLVSQDVHVFHGTVRENVAYGRPGATAEEVDAALRVAEAEAFVRALPQGADTVVGERGQKLSGGQRQRLSIARAVLKDPAVLVLDEATSSVDNETEAAIQRSLERVSRDRTTVVVAHRLSTIRHADRVYVLDRGRVVEQGRHEELVAAGGAYAGLWRVQTGDAVHPGE